MATLEGAKKFDAFKVSDPNRLVILGLDKQVPEGKQYDYLRAQVQTMRLAQIKKNGVGDLTASIRQLRKVVTPVVIDKVKVKVDGGETEEWQIVLRGRRRVLAAREVVAEGTGEVQLLAVLGDAHSVSAFDETRAENAGRMDDDALTIAADVYNAVEAHKARTPDGDAYKEVGEIFGRGSQWARAKYKLHHKASDKVKAALAAGTIDVTAAEELSGLKTAEEQDGALDSMIESGLVTAKQAKAAKKAKKKGEREASATRKVGELRKALAGLVFDATELGKNTIEYRNNLVQQDTILWALGMSYEHDKATQKALMDALKSAEKAKKAEKEDEAN